MRNDALVPILIILVVTLSTNIAFHLWVMKAFIEEKRHQHVMLCIQYSETDVIKEDTFCQKYFKEGYDHATQEKWN